MADSNTLVAMWYHKRWPWLSNLLLPLSWLFYLLIALRRRYYRSVAKPDALPVPVIVVGNINLGGSGKSPLLIALALHLRQKGFSPGVISRGYGSNAPHYPFTVTDETSAELAGDEPLMIAQRSACPVVIDPDRLTAAKKLVQTNHCDLILSDDGLQHYRLPRDLEIIVVDGQRLLGNERLLPAGPLREPASRLRQADCVVVNGGLDGAGADAVGFNTRKQLKPDACFGMQLQPISWQRLSDGNSVAAQQQPWTSERKSKGRVHAVAGIGNPQRFFQTLKDLGVDFIPHCFPDHHIFQWSDISFQDDLPVVMTEKDAVKCRVLLEARTVQQQRDQVQIDRYWYLSVQAQLDEAFFPALEERLRILRRQ